MLKIATAPGTWGVEPPLGPADPPWPLVLDEIAAAGFDGVELGPPGYLPEEPARLRHELGRRGLELVAGHVMEPFHRREARLDILATARRTCRALAGEGGRCLILIEALVPERSATAGRSEPAPRLGADGWTTLLATVDEVARIAADDFGLAVAFHPHAGTYVEFADEIERLLDAADQDRVGLCIDSGHAAYAGLDPSELVRATGGRLRHVHLKDLDSEVRARGLAFDVAVAAGVFRPLGDGSVDLLAFLRALDDHEYRGWATFEQDRLSPDPQARADAERSLAHIRAAVRA